MNIKNVKWVISNNKQKWRKPMTIIIGIKCINGIVIGSDSQITAEYFPFKKVGYDKIFEYKHENKKNFYNLAGAGDPDYIFKTNLEILKRFIGEEIDWTITFGDICEEAVNKICKKYVVDRAENLGLFRFDESRIPDLSKWQRQFDSLGFSFVAGVVLNRGDKAQHDLYLVDLRGVAKRIDTYCVTGSGFLFAEYVLSRLYREEMNIWEAIRVIIYVIEEVKQHDPNCGGEVKISVIHNKLGLMPPNIRKKAISEKDLLKKVDDKIREAWQDLIINPAKKIKEFKEAGKKQNKGKRVRGLKAIKNEKKGKKTNK